MDNNRVLQNLLNGTASEEDIELLKQGLMSGEVSIGGNVNQSVIIIGNGNTVELPPAALDRLGGRFLLGDLDRDLTGDEIANGLSRLETELPLRAPILLTQFHEQTRRLRPTLKNNSKSLSDHALKGRVEALAQVNSLCMDALDISFNALCLGEEPPEYDSRSPFRGLESFRSEDSEFFLGREALTRKLVAKIQSHPFLAVLGASGSGKSSLVMAGLIPTLGSDYFIFRPGTNPLETLETVKENILVIVDQFEELFTITREEGIRKEFIAKLLEISKRNKVIITLRSDFLGEVAAYRNLNDEVQNHLENVPPMNIDELRRAMEGQAGVVGLRFEADLSQKILDDVEGEPGAMPLLQHALWELWNRRHGQNLRASEYRAFGGVQRAIAATADEYYERFNFEDRERMRNIFVRLTRLDESGRAARDTRRRVKVHELVYRNDSSAQTLEFVHQLVDARLLVTSSVVLEEQEVEVVHEALIRNWPRLRGWLDEDRLSLMVQEDVREAASTWDASDNDSDALSHRGGKLEDALHLMRNPRVNLSAMERKYLEICEKNELGFTGKLRSLAGKYIWVTLFFALAAAVAVYGYLSGEQLYAALPVGTFIPLIELFIIYRLDKYRVVEFRQTLLCLLGGAVGYALTASINASLLGSDIISRYLLMRVTDPIVTTVINSSVLYMILRRVKIARAVDGMIYGAAVGTGFAIPENYEYIFANVGDSLYLAIARGLSVNLMHISVVGLAGLILVAARFDKNRIVRITKMLSALMLPTIIHSLYNILTVNDVLLILIIAFAMSWAGLLVILIRRSIRQDEKWTDEFLRGGLGTRGRSTLDIMRQVTQSVQRLFGSVRASQLERFLIMRARRSVLQRFLQSENDPELKRPIEEQLNVVQKKTRGARGAIGTYCWESIKRTMPELNHITEL